jgi:hypothetical protein
VILTRTRNIALALAAFLAYGVAQDSKPPAKKPMTQPEYAEYQAATKETSPAARLPLLDKWAKDFPQSDYADVRQQAYLITYQQMNRPKDAFNTATEILKTDPNNVNALTSIVSYIYQFNPPSPSDLDTAEKACNTILNNTDAIYAPDKKPADKTDAQWAALKPEMKVYSERTIGWIDLQRKNDEKAEADLTKTLQLDPTQAVASLWLSQALFAQRTAHPEKQPEYLFETARAAAYDGPNSLPVAARNQLKTSLAKTYAQYHGSSDGLDQMLAEAKTNALPPADFKIPSTADIEAAKIKAQEAADAANPMLALWRKIRIGLTGDGSDAFWMALNMSDVPGNGDPNVTKFKGKLISMTPAVRPKELVLAVEKPDVPDVTLKFEMALPGKMDVGSDLEFSGQVLEFKKDPYMLTIKVDKADINWTGKNPPARRTTKK